MKGILGNVDCRQVLDLIPHMVIIVGSDGEVLFRNEVLADYLGELSDERQWQSNIHPDDREQIKNGFIKPKKNGK